MRRRATGALVGMASLLAVWFALARLGWVGPTLLADPLEVLGVLLHDGGPGGGLFSHALGTLGRALAGWLLALALGVSGGLLVGWRSALGWGVEPVVELARAVPPIMVFPVLLVAFDFGGPAYVGTIAFGCAPVAMLAVARGVRRTSPERLELLRVFGVGPGVRAMASVMEVLPSAFLAARITLSLSLVIAVVTEMVFTPRSGRALGALAREAEISFDTPVFYATLVLVGLFGFGANALLRAVEARLGVEGTPTGD